MTTFDNILNWTLKSGSHDFPGPDGGTCINEAALVAAGFEYRAIQDVNEMPPCFSRVIAQYALTLNDNMRDDPRQCLLPYVDRLSGTADTPDVEWDRIFYLVMNAVRVPVARVLDEAGFPSPAKKCRGATTLSEACFAAEVAADATAMWSAEKNSAWRTSVAKMTYSALGASMAAGMPGSGSAERAVIQAALAVAHAAAAGLALDDVTSSLDGVLAIGRQAETLDPVFVSARLERAKSCALERVSDDA
jgi:hypothetical protein